MIDEPKEMASPACLAHEADDSYMGFASNAEIARFLADIDTATAASIREMLPRIRDDELHRKLRARLAAVESTKTES